MLANGEKDKNRSLINALARSYAALSAVGNIAVSDRIAV